MLQFNWGKTKYKEEVAMKKILLAVVLVMSFLVLPVVAFSAEIIFDPSTQACMTGKGTLDIWKVPEIGDNVLTAKADSVWPTEAVISDWSKAIGKAQSEKKMILVGYNPVFYTIWYLAVLN
jgi:hypothetical protein